MWAHGNAISEDSYLYRNPVDGEGGGYGTGAKEWGRLGSLAEQARNRPQTNIDRYWLDQDIAQGQESRGLQQQGLGQLREAAMGNAPSQAALMANMARGRAAATGVGATGGLAARQAAMGQNRAMQAAAMQGAGARSDELGRATGAYLVGTGQAMGGDLRQRGASADEAYRTAKTALRDKEMSAQLGLEYEKARQRKKLGWARGLSEARDIDSMYNDGVSGANSASGASAAQAGIGAAVGLMGAMMSGITTKTDIAPTAASPKMGAPLQPDQIAAAFGPDVAAAVERSRNKYKPQNALAQMPQFSQGVEVAPALARSNEVPVDLAAMQANADVPSDVRAKKDIEMSGKSNPNSAGKKLIVGQPAPLPALAPPQEESWIPIGQISGGKGLARIHSDANSKKEIALLRKQNEHMKEFIGREHGLRAKVDDEGSYLFRHDRRPPGDAPSGTKPSEKDKPSEHQMGPDSPALGRPKPGVVRETDSVPRVPFFSYGARPAMGMQAQNPQGPSPAMRAAAMSGGALLPDQDQVGRVVSDESQKSGGPGSHTADAFLDSLSDSASTYRYKDPSMEPSTTGGTGGKYLGIMAQRVEQTPEIGKQLVKDTPQGKVVEGQAMLSALAGGLGRLHQKVKEMEGRRGR